MSTEKKRILFYKLVGEGPKDKKGKRPAVSLAPAFTAIKVLPAIKAGKGSRYMAYKSDELLMEIFEVKGPQVRGAFAVKRKNGLQTENAGTWANLTLAAGAGLAEIRHFIYWTDKERLGIEVNGRGPGIGALSDYIVEKAGKAIKAEKVDAQIYLATDQFDRLDAATKISSATIGIYRESISQASALGTEVAGGLKAMAKATNARELRVEWKLGDRREDASLTLPMIRRLKAAVGKPKTREALSTLRVTATDEENDGKMGIIDLLEDRYAGHEDVTVGPNGVVDRKSMLDAIRQAAKKLDS